MATTTSSPVQYTEFVRIFSTKLNIEDVTQQYKAISIQCTLTQKDYYHSLLWKNTISESFVEHKQSIPINLSICHRLLVIYLDLQIFGGIMLNESQFIGFIRHQWQGGGVTTSGYLIKKL